mgnify:FL=1
MAGSQEETLQAWLTEHAADAGVPGVVGEEYNTVNNAYQNLKDSNNAFSNRRIYSRTPEQLEGMSEENIAAIRREEATTGRGRFMTGIGNLGVGLTQSAAHLADKFIPGAPLTERMDNYAQDRQDDIRRAKQEFTPETANDFDWWELGGFAAPALLPLPASKQTVGTSLIKSSAPFIKKGISALKSAALRGATAGSLGGIAEPVVDLGEGQSYAGKKAFQMASGGFLGAILGPILTGVALLAPSAAQKVLNLLKNSDADAEQIIREAVPPDKIDNVIAAMENEVAGVPNRVVPVTPGETAANAGDVGLPSVERLAAREGDDLNFNAARNVAQTKVLRDEGRPDIPDDAMGPFPNNNELIAKQLRTRAAYPSQKLANESTESINMAPVIDEIDTLRATNSQNADVISVLDEIEISLYPNRQRLIDGEPQAPELTYTQAKSVLANLKKLKNKEGAPVGTEGSGMAVKNNLTRLINANIGRVNPAHLTSQAVYKSASQPINQASIFNVLEKIVDEPLLRRGPGNSTIGLAPKPGAQATNFVETINEPKQLLDTATGFQRGADYLENTLNPSGVKTTDRIARDLTSQRQFDTVASKGAKEIREAVAEATSGVPAPAILQREFVLYNSLLSKISESSQRQVLSQIESILKPGNQAEVLSILSDIPLPERAAVRSLLNSVTNAAGFAGTEMSEQMDSPAYANALREQAQ